MSSSITIEPFHVKVSDEVLGDLKQRLKLTRWPDKETVDDWSQGTPLHIIKDLCSYWQTQYDWKPCETWINKYSFKAKIEDYEIHFLHIKSRHEHALPLLLLHGWPGSILEFRKSAGPLTDPTAHGGQAEDAFDLIIPSMPGYGFSAEPTSTGTGYARMASLYTQLMKALKYDRWVAQGGDFGADVCAILASKNAPASLAAVHLNGLFPDARREIMYSGRPTNEENEALAKQATFEAVEFGYFKQQATRPQTVGYGLADSPAGQAAWIYEKLWSWTEHDGDLETVFSKDEILDNIMTYWLGNAGASSARLYWEEKMDVTSSPISIPIGVTQFPLDNMMAPRHWAERYYSNIIHWSYAPKGGHFAAWEVPDIFVEEVRTTFRKIRT